MEKNIPKHVIIIPDGNRRHAKARGFLAHRGHEDGFECFKKLWSCARDAGVQFITFWAFSTENWSRSHTEVRAIMALLLRALQYVQIEMHKKQVRCIVIGRRDRLPQDIVKLIELIESETKDYTSFSVVLAIDYGRQDELDRASEKLLDSGDKNKRVHDFLDTTLAGIPDPDLLIRTGGECRLSGYEPGYAELYFTDILFPVFGEAQFHEALDEFSRRKRNFGT